MQVRTRLGMLVIAALCMLAPAACAAAADGSPSDVPPAAPTLRAALESLQRAGLNLVFSNALVRESYQVEEPVDTGLPLHEQASRLLAPFDLALERTPNDLWFVVRATPPDPPPPPATAPAQAAAAPLLEEVLVTPSRQRLVRDGHLRQRLEQRDLAAVPSPGGDLMLIVNQLPGLASVGVGGRSHVRGGDTNEVLYRLDGVQIIDPFHMGDFHALFSAVNPAVVDAVNVYTGAFPVSFGARLSGVVDIELTEATRPFQGRVNLDLISASMHAQGFAGYTQWLVSARRSTVHHLLGRLENDYGEPRLGDELARLVWEGAAASLTLGVMNAYDELELVDSDAGESAAAEDRSTTVWLRGAWSPADRLELAAFASHARVRRNREGVLDRPDDAVGALLERRRFDVSSLGAELKWQPGSDWLLHAGIEGQHQRADFLVDIESRYGALGLPLHPDGALARSFHGRRSGDHLSAFALMQGRLSQRWSLEYGLRYDLQDIDPVHDSKLAPRLQLTLQALPDLRLFANVGRYAQHEQLYELQIDDGLLELNPPQLADQFGMGADWQGADGVRVRAEVYRRVIDDPWPHFENIYDRWVLLPELHSDRVELRPGRVRSAGVELTFDHRLSERLRWSASVALARAEGRLDGAWRPRPWEQERSLHLGVDWRPQRWVIGAGVTYHSGWPITSRQQQLPASDAAFYDRRLRDFLSVDLHVARRVELPRSTLEWYLDVTNISGRANVGGYRYELQDDIFSRERRRLLPLVPVLGLSWSW